MAAFPFSENKKRKMTHLLPMSDNNVQFDIKFSSVERVRLVMLKDEVINHLGGPDSLYFHLSFANHGLFCRDNCVRKSTFCFVLRVFCIYHKHLKFNYE